MTLELARPGRHGNPRNNAEALWENINDDASFREELQRWRTEDIEQRVLNNAVVLWDRYAEANRRFSEERSEQLKSFANLSALITGFAIVSYLQFDFDVADTNQGLVFAFGFTMAVVVGLSINAMSLCGLIHAAVLKTAKLYVDESEEAEYMRRSREFALQYRVGDRPPQPRRDIQSFWLNHCEDEWQKAFFLFSSSVAVFYANLILASWIKFPTVPAAAIVMTVVFSLGFAYFVGIHVRWLGHITGSGVYQHGPSFKEMDMPMGLPFDWHQRPRRFGFFTAQGSMARSHKDS